MCIMEDRITWWIHWTVPVACPYTIVLISNLLIDEGGILMLVNSGLHRLQPVFVCCVKEGVYDPKIAVTTDPWLVEWESPPSETRWCLEEPYQSCLKILDNVLVVNLVLTITVITFRRVSVYLQHFQYTSGSYIDSVCYYTRLVTELRPIK